MDIFEINDVRILENGFMSRSSRKFESEPRLVIITQTGYMYSLCNKIKPCDDGNVEVHPQGTVMKQNVSILLSSLY